MPYTRDDIMDRERELLGVWLSGTPFDRVDAQTLELSYKASEIDTGPEGEYIAYAIVNRVTPRNTKAGDRYAWLTLYAQDGDLDVVCWPRYWADYQRDLRPDALVVAVLSKDERGVKLTGLATT
jgi:DNA polymerase III alpha subunit